MQAMTIAIGSSGIKFFARQYLAATLNNLLSQLKPPDKTVPVYDFSSGSGGESWNYSRISIALSNGSIQNFRSTFQDVRQGVTNDAKKQPVFTLTMKADNFKAFYRWVESFHYVHNYATYNGKIPEWHHDPGDSSNNYDFNPTVDSLNATITVGFIFNGSKNEWEFVVSDTSADGKITQHAIPARSILNGQVNDCFNRHVDAATEQAVDAIDFATPLHTAIAGIIQTIPGSGELGGGIKYDFSLSDPSQLRFPNNDGIQMGVKGGASYKGAAFSGATPSVLPLPTPPADADAHHLNIYVSNYEVDALNWAFFKAGALDAVVNPTDIVDAKILKVATYITAEPSLKPYQAFAMQARVSPIDAPVTAFETVWEFTKDVIDSLRKKLPADLADFLNGIQGNNYVSKSSLEDYMKDADVPAEHFKIIEDTAQRMGMVVTSNLNFDLVIQGKEKPDIRFSVLRTDILSKLRLGIAAGNAQTMQYDFTNVTYRAKFISSTVSGFKGGDYFTDSVWSNAGEPGYEKVLADMGKTGVPLPIMKDFQFDFTNAELSIQNGYVSILASVLYKTK